MPDLDGDDNPIGAIAKDRVAQDDVRRNPSGIYSGQTKRLAISDDKFVDVRRRNGDTPEKDEMKTGKLKPAHENMPHSSHSLSGYRHKRPTE
jgi:hypothetical protein